MSFSVIDVDKVISNEYTNHFRSVIAFGKARIVEGNEKNEAFKALLKKHSGDQPEEILNEKLNGCKQIFIVSIDVDHMTGKEAMEYVKAKNRKSVHYENILLHS